MAEATRPLRAMVRGKAGFTLALTAGLVLIAVFGPFIVTHDPLATAASEALQPPSASHWFGTDQLGRDVFSRTVASARIDLSIGLIAVSISLVAGTAIGALAGWCGGWVDAIAGRFIDAIMAFPLFVLAVGIAAALGNSVSSVVIATSIVNLPFFARQVRTEVNRRRTAGWVEAALLARIHPAAIVTFHILPNLAGPLATQCSLNMGWAILNAAGLSFIGLGIRPPEPEWGVMVADGASYIFSGEWWIFAFPGVALMLAVLAFTMLGDLLRDAFDPRRG